MLFIPLLGLSGMGRMVPGLSIPPQDRHLGAASEPSSPPLGHSAGQGSAHLRMLQEGCTAATRAGGGGREASALGEAPAEAVPSVPQPCPHSDEVFLLPHTVLAAARGHPSAPLPRAGASKWDFFGQSSAVVPNFPLSSPEESRAAAGAAPQFQVPSWLPAAAASSGSTLPALRVVLHLSRSRVQQAGLQAEHSRAGRTCPTG